MNEVRNIQLEIQDHLKESKDNFASWLQPYQIFYSYAPELCSLAEFINTTGLETFTLNKVTRYYNQTSYPRYKNHKYLLELCVSAHLCTNIDQHYTLTETGKQFFHVIQSNHYEYYTPIILCCYTLLKKFKVFIGDLDSVCRQMRFDAKLNRYRGTISEFEGLHLKFEIPVEVLTYTPSQRNSWVENYHQASLEAGEVEDLQKEILNLTGHIKDLEIALSKFEDPAWITDQIKELQDTLNSIVTKRTNLKKKSKDIPKRSGFDFVTPPHVYHMNIERYYIPNQWAEFLKKLTKVESSSEQNYE